jgi:hypothetical protein
MTENIDLLYFCGFSGIVKGALELYGIPPLKLPTNITVLGYVEFYRSRIEYIPEGWDLQSPLYISFTAIDKLPHDIKINNSVFIADNPWDNKLLHPKGVTGKIFVR